MLAFLPLLPILLLAAAVLVVYLLHLARRSIAYSWLAAAIGALLAWMATILLGRYLPLELTLIAWPDRFFTNSPTLLVDERSWPYAAALTTLVLAVILTDVARFAEMEWSSWMNSLAMAALGLLAVFAGSPLTLLLAWAAIDIVELAIFLARVELDQDRERVVIAFSAKVAGLLLLLAGEITARGSGVSLTFGEIPRSASIYILLAIGFRLGIVPLHVPFLPEAHLRRGLGTVARLAPVAASLSLLTRTALTGVSPSLEPALLGLASLAAIYAGFYWVIARDELEGRPFWMLGFAALALAAAARGQPEASQAWGIAMLLPGGLLFLFSARHRFLLGLPVLGFIALTTLPLMPTWLGARLFTAPFSPWLAPLFIAQILLLMGFLRHALRPGEGLTGAERWVWLIYPVGLFFLPAVHFLLGWWAGLGDSPINLGRLLPGVLTLALLAAGIYAWQNIPEISPRYRTTLGAILSLRWLYRLLWETYRGLGRFTGFITQVIEGDGGVLWTLLLLTLLMAFLIQGRLGG